MDGRLSVDVYAKISDPPCRVELDPLDSWVSVVIGGSQFSPSNILQLWFRDSDAVVKLGQELISAGTELAKRKAEDMCDCVPVAERGGSEIGAVNQ